MAKYKVIIDGEEQDEIFYSESEAEEHASYLASCARQGAEDLHMSNPGDYEYDEDDDVEWEVVEVDD